MKKQLLIAFAVLFSATMVRGQIADGSLLEENIIITDLDGNTYDVFAMLDEGKTVVLDLYAEWCGPCWNYHNTGSLEEAYESYGPDGTDELMVIGVETDPSTPVTAITGGAGSTYGWDWTDGTPYPMADENIGNIFEQAYYPYIIRICPNRQIFELGQVSADLIIADVGTCAPPASGEINPEVLSYIGDLSTCDVIETAIQFQNLGSETLTQATFVVSAEGVEGNVEASAEWAGSLETYEIGELTIGDVSVAQSGNIEISVASTDDDMNVFEQYIEVAMETTDHIVVTITLDDYPTETSWKVFNESGSVVASGGPYSNSSANSEVTDEFDVELGCHKFVIYDQYGDGMNGAYWGGTNGVYEVRASDGTVIATGGGDDQWDSEESPFDASTIDGVNDAQFEGSVNLFPNPTTGILNLQLDLDQAQDVKLQVRDILGRTVLSEDFGQLAQGRFDYTTDLGNLTKGIYLITLTSGQTQLVKKVTLTD